MRFDEKLDLSDEVWRLTEDTPLDWRTVWTLKEPVDVRSIFKDTKYYLATKSDDWALYRTFKRMKNG